MKTFEEALETVMAKGQGNRELDSKLSVICDDMKRYQGIVEEIAQRPEVKLMAEAMGSLLCCETHALIAMFTNGVIVGMEMEKAE